VKNKKVVAGSKIDLLFQYRIFAADIIGAFGDDLGVAGMVLNC